MFVDQVTVEVHAGKGGDGAVAFRREKFVPFGGPAGGDGGRGGSIVFYVDSGLNTLMDFRYHRHFKAHPGMNGQGKQMFGKAAEDTRVAVPAGTSVTDADTGETLGDLTENGQELVVARGGRGGRGNVHFVSPKNTAPEIAENGEPGQDRFVKLELKVLADVGLVGFPSVGKSTLLAAVTGAKPKIAAYQFTTLVPNLGMVRLDDGSDFVMADLPGLVEGASTGVGLGLEFLRHVERTRVILHLVEMDPNNAREPIDDYHQIQHELTTYDDHMLERPEIVVATKMDMPGSEERFTAFHDQLVAEGVAEDRIMSISSVTHSNLQVLMHKTADLLANAPYVAPKQDAEPETMYKAEPADEIHIEDTEHAWVVTGTKVERLAAMSNLQHDDGVIRFARQLRKLGVDAALKDAGAVNGDQVMIGDLTFEYEE
ncbi:GTPase ObgE [Lacticaseibacillus pabuli]|uniref:GTPase Obg n=1 Tax=Lacticaseibacillus pabuli TaxID=3025672 RepID=A0ABY7WNA7_9LACO|nr:GTPase ObgE [Lacticaseibacillus sp. KACC 23028]WDF81616.1 GTPase ObgE [Lacticaseibacillus sp. KACC 23028]